MQKNILFVCIVAACTIVGLQGSQTRTIPAAQQTRAIHPIVRSSFVTYNPQEKKLTLTSPTTFQTTQRYYSVHPAGTGASLHSKKYRQILCALLTVGATSIIAWNQRDEWSSKRLGLLGAVGAVLIFIILKNLQNTILQLNKYKLQDPFIDDIKKYATEQLRGSFTGEIEQYAREVIVLQLLPSLGNPSEEGDNAPLDRDQLAFLIEEHLKDINMEEQFELHNEGYSIVETNIIKKFQGLVAHAIRPLREENVQLQQFFAAGMMQAAAQYAPMLVPPAADVLEPSSSPVYTDPSPIVSPFGSPPPPPAPPAARFLLGNQSMSAAPSPDGHYDSQATSAAASTPLPSSATSLFAPPPPETSERDLLLIDAIVADVD